MIVVHASPAKVVVLFLIEMGNTLQIPVLVTSHLSLMLFVQPQVNHTIHIEDDSIKHQV